MLKGKYESCFYRLNYNKIGAADPITSETSKNNRNNVYNVFSSKKKGNIDILKIKGGHQER